MSSFLNFSRLTPYRPPTRPAHTYYTDPNSNSAASFQEDTPMPDSNDVRMSQTGPTSPLEALKELAQDWSPNAAQVLRTAHEVGASSNLKKLTAKYGTLNEFKLIKRLHHLVFNTVNSHGDCFLITILRGIYKQLLEIENFESFKADWHSQMGENNAYFHRKKYSIDTSFLSQFVTFADRYFNQYRTFEGRLRYMLDFTFELDPDNAKTNNHNEGAQVAFYRALGFEYACSRDRGSPDQTWSLNPNLLNDALNNPRTTIMMGIHAEGISGRSTTGEHEINHQVLVIGSEGAVRYEGGGDLVLKVMDPNLPFIPSQATTTMLSLCDTWDLCWRLW